jgi:Flp pilus assembly protein CpaB
MKQKNLILMVVAVGCGLVAAFLTSQMSAKGTVDQVEVVVAAKDLPVGTMLTREEIQKSIKTKKLPKDGLPPAYCISAEELVDKRLSRPVRAEETFNPQDLSKGGAITLPEGYDMVSLQVGSSQAAAGFVGPGSRVNVLATVRLGSKLQAFPLLVNMLVVAVDTNTTYNKDGTFPSMNTVSFAVTEKQALLLSLAKQRGCTLELLLRHPSKSSKADEEYDIEKVIKLLQDEKQPAKIVGGDNGNGEGTDAIKPTKPVDPGNPGNPPKDPVEPVSPTAPPPVQKIEMVKVLIANRDIAPNTVVTKDLVAEAFELKELPKDIAVETHALPDLSEAYGKAFRTGVAKGQWVTPNMVGLQASKDPPQYEYVPTKPGTVPANPATPGKWNTYDVAIHTTSGTVIVRYAEVAPGKWKKIAELTPEQAAKGDKPDAAPKAPDKKFE